MKIDKGVDLRLTTHHILYDIYKKNITLNDSNVLKKIQKYNNQDISFIKNLCLNSMRYYFHSEKIIKLFAYKKIKTNAKLLLISGITQLVFMDVKDYAAINSTVEVAKKINVFHGFINACLKKISLNRLKLKKIIVGYDDLPKWFKNEIQFLNKKDKNIFIENFYKEPSLHLVFKNNTYKIKFEKEIVSTSILSGFLDDKVKFEKLNSFRNGDWWIQDFSSFLPLSRIPNKLLNFDILDLCSAPGGKAFQLLSKNKRLVLNDKNKLRIELLKKNLKRLKFNAKISNHDVMNINTRKKYEFIILDAPCSAVGTIRKNPEIFFKSKKPELKKLLNLQELMLDKSLDLLKVNGRILYMVCSFLKCETFDQVDKFLEKHKNVSIENEFLKDKKFELDNFFRGKYIYTLPSKFKNHSIDGYFAVCLKKNN